MRIAARNTTPTPFQSSSMNCVYSLRIGSRHGCPMCLASMTPARPRGVSLQGGRMTKDSYVRLTLGIFTVFVWALIGFVHWFG
jgi:hypothetical protein